MEKEYCSKSKFILKCLIPEDHQGSIFEPDLLNSLSIIMDFHFLIKKPFYTQCKCNFTCKCNHITIFIGNSNGDFNRIIEAIELLTWGIKSKLYYELFPCVSSIDYANFFI